MTNSETAWGPYCQMRPRSPRTPIADAVEEVAKRLDLVPTESMAKLIKPLATERIKAFWRWDGSRIEGRCWPGAYVNIDQQTVLFANGERKAFIDIDRDSYQEWLAEITAPIAAELPPKARRYAGDDALVEEGVDGLRANKWSNSHQAALELANRADGPATLASKVDRIERKISARFRDMTPRNIPKHPE